MPSAERKRDLSELDYEHWLQEFHNLQRQVRDAGGFQLGDTKEEVIANLRKQRRLLFEEEYGHLYA